MENDPIAENQTDVTIATLMARKDGDLLMNQAVAATLAYMKKLGNELAEVKSSLWSPDALDKLIKSKHDSECRECGVRKWVENYQRKLEHDGEEKARAPKPSLWSFLLSERGLLVVVILVITFAYVRLTLGQQGYKDVTGTASQLMSGGK